MFGMLIKILIDVWKAVNLFLRTFFLKEMFHFFTVPVSFSKTKHYQDKMSIENFIYQSLRLFEAQIAFIMKRTLEQRKN
jgi:hypothetical protein